MNVHALSSEQNCELFVSLVAKTPASRKMNFFSRLSLSVLLKIFYVNFDGQEVVF